MNDLDLKIYESDLFISCMDVIDFVRQIDDSDRFLFSICNTGEQIANLKNYNYIVKPTGLDDYVVVLKDDAIEIVYFYKCCLEDALGIFAEKALASGNVYDYYGQWEVDFDNMIDKKTDYGKFLKSAIYFTYQHGVTKNEWVD